MVEALLPRPALAAALHATAGTVKVLCAPPGSGKTTALLQHYQLLQQGGEAVYWLSVCPQDNDPALLRRRLHRSFAPHTAFSPDETPRLPQHLHAFIDGLEWLHAPSALTVAAQFLLTLPASSHAYTTLHDLQDPLLQEGRLRGLLQVIEADQLRWSVAETAQLFGPEWSRDQILRLHYQMHGWIAGLRLLAQAPEQTRTWLNAPEHAQSLPPALASYLETLACCMLPETTLQALMELSVLDRFLPTMLADMPQAPCGWELVDAQLQQGSILLQEAAPSPWVRCHPAWGVYLRRRLKQHAPHRYQAVQQFAACWLASHSYTEEAARHALRLDDAARKEALLEQAGAPLVLNLGEGPEMDLEIALPAERAAERPLLFLGQVYHRFRHGRLAEAESMFQRACTITGNFQQIHQSDQQEEVRAWFWMLHAALRCARDLPLASETIEALETESHQHADRYPLLAAGLASVHAFTQLDEGRYAVALAVCQRGLKIQQDQSLAKVRIFLRVHQSYAAIACDRLETAQLALEDAQRLAHQSCTYGSYEMHCVQCMWMLLHYERNELKCAQRLLTDALAGLRSVFGFTRIYIEIFAIAIHLAGRSGNTTQVERLLQDASQLAQEQQLPRLQQMVHLLRLREHLRQKAWGAAQECAQSTEFQHLLHPATDTPFPHSIQVPALLAVAQLEIELGHVRACLHQLKQLPERWMETADQRLIWQYRLLQLRVHMALRHYRAAADTLESALSLAQRAGLVLRCLEAQAQWLPAMQTLEQLGRPLPEALAAWVRALSVTYSDAQTPASTLSATPAPIATQRTSPLSPRETEILALMAEGCINKEIAARLQISEGTVKTHRKHIHEKLGASSRSQALLRAKELLLL